MSYAIEMTDLRKTLGGFQLDVPEMRLPKGYVIGLIGENGAGKSTLIKCMTGAIVPDSGDVRILDGHAPTDRVGIVFDECHFHSTLDGSRIGRIMQRMFPNWDQSLYEDLMEKLCVPMDVRIGRMSRGMRMKIQLAVALSHDADLLLLDEATAGLDPAARDDLIDLVMGYMREEDHTVVMSTHITNDLERVADHIVFIHKGRVVMDGPKDEILENYGLVRGTDEEIRPIPRELIVRTRRDEFCTTALVRNRSTVKELLPETVVDPASLDDILVMTVKGVEP